MADYVTSLLVITGPPETLDAFAAKHLAGGTFDFNSVRPMPPELQIESSSSVETGYAALYGNWQEVAGYWMFKEPAQQFGFPFPLASREQVIQSLRSFESADQYLVPAAAYHDNVQKHGHGEWSSWCTEHWGTQRNADEVLVKIEREALSIRFVTGGAYPKPILKALSLAYPELAIHVRRVDEHLRNASDYVLIKGRETRKTKRSPKEIYDEASTFASGSKA